MSEDSQIQAQNPVGGGTTKQNTKHKTLETPWDLSSGIFPGSCLIPTSHNTHTPVTFPQKENCASIIWSIHKESCPPLSLLPQDRNKISASAFKTYRRTAQLAKRQKRKGRLFHLLISQTFPSQNQSERPASCRQGQEISVSPLS